MSYEHGRTQETVATAASLATAAVIGTFSPAYQPVVVRAVSLIFTTAVNATGAVTVKKRPTAGSTSGETTIDILNYTTTTGAQGKCVYIDGLNTKISPTEELIFQVTDATPTVGNAHCGVSFDETWEVPANNTDMAVTT